MRLLDNPKDIPFLASGAFQEIYYRLLISKYGPLIIQMTLAGSNMHRIAQVIDNIKSNIARPIIINELAESANMSISAFYSHFKKITALSPLQYQKRLRLTEARQIMLAGEMDATRAAYFVGYESPSQFSREYARMFGEPPRRDTIKYQEAY